MLWLWVFWKKSFQITGPLYLKGYLCYKMITSQNVSSKAEIKKFFISWKNYVPFPSYSSFCIFNHSMIYQISDVTMSIWTYLLNHKSWIHKTWLVYRYKQGQQFSVIFWTIWETEARFQVLFNLATCPNYSITKYAKIPVFYFFEEVNKGQLKMVHVNR